MFTVHYQISAHPTHAQALDVAIEITLPAPQNVQLMLPTWIPGSYLIREFSRHLHAITATTAQGQPLLCQKIDKHRWCVAATETHFTVRYTVYAYDLSVRGAYRDQQRVFINPACVCLELENVTEATFSLGLSAFDNPNWAVATALPAQNVNSQGWGRYTATDYQHLIDCPIEIGSFQRVCFDVEGLPHEFVLSGADERVDIARLVNDTAAICREQIRFFGGETPFTRYVFLLHVGDGLYGGLEHTSSTALLADRKALPLHNTAQTSDDYLDLLSLISHEYFHAWNVKTIKPQAFTPYQLQAESYTRLLWAFEGITSYYDELFVLRAGLMSLETYCNKLAHSISHVQRQPGQQRQTLEESSFDAWIKFYRPDENTANEVVSYYQKGALAALILDLAIRRHSQQTQSLDDVMRHLWRHVTTTQQGLAETEWEQLASAYLGWDISPLCDVLLRSTQPLPLAEYLADAGIDVSWHVAAHDQDKGKAITLSSALPALAQCGVSLGVRTQTDVLGCKLHTVYQGGAAAEAGLAGGDIILAINGLRIKDLDSALSGYQAGDKIAVHILRREYLLQFEIILSNKPLDTCYLQHSDFALQQNIWPAAIV